MSRTNFVEGHGECECCGRVQVIRLTHRPPTEAKRWLCNLCIGDLEPGSYTYVRAGAAS